MTAVLPSAPIAASPELAILPTEFAALGHDEPQKATSVSVNDLRPGEIVASLTGIALAFLVPTYLAATRLGLFLVDATAPSAMLINELAIWLATLVILAIVLFWHRLPLTSIGLSRPSPADICLGAMCTAPLLILSLAVGGLLDVFGAPPSGPTQAALILSLPVWLQLFVAITAGFTEEILFRGYAIERATLVTGNRIAGALIPILIFGVVHTPFWGLPHAIIACSTGFWLSLLYLWRRNLWVTITAHALLDGVLFVAIDLKAVHLAAS